MRWFRYLFMNLMYLGLLIGLIYGGIEIYDFVRGVMTNGFSVEVIEPSIRGIMLSSLELAVIGQSYVVTRDFIGEEDKRASKYKKDL